MANFGIISAEPSSLAAKWSCDMTMGIAPFGTERKGRRANVRGAMTSMEHS